MMEIASVTLHNEMDLILANRRAMHLAELAGLSIGAQTTFATAVSEISRNSIEKGKNGCLLLGVADIHKKDKYIIARIKDLKSSSTSMEGLEYAKKLADKFSISNTGGETSVELQFHIPLSHKLIAANVETWKSQFKNEPPISPYEEIKRKNEQLQVVASKLLESENQYKALTNSLPMIIFSSNIKGEVVYANNLFESFTGVTLEELNLTKWKNIVHAEDHDEFAMLFDEKIVADASVVKTQCRLKKAVTNEYIWHLVSVSPIKDDRENIFYWTGFLVDINAEKLVEKTLQDNKNLEEAQTLLKKKEEGLQADITELNRSNTELSQFAFIASHDLQEPLRKIILYSDYLLNKYVDKVDEKAGGYLKSMINASHRMKTLTEDILSFSHVNNKQLELQQLDLNKVARECLEDVELLIAEKNATIILNELITIEADEALIRQLFYNLISNALKYSKDNIPARVLISCRQLGNNEVAIYFEDNGIGFEEKYIDKIFTLFQRLHGKESYKGTGLGLAICRKIVQLHNGRIDAKGQLDKGATFIVTIPIKYKENKA